MTRSRKRGIAWLLTANALLAAAVAMPPKPLDATEAQSATGRCSVCVSPSGGMNYCCVVDCTTNCSCHTWVECQI